MAISQRSVFVGNIPYGSKLEELTEVLEMVGPVVSFRIVTDKETGKPKGFGFCEFMDSETALSARRNLQGYEFNGRPLRVDSAERDKKPPPADSTAAGNGKPDPIASHLGKLPRHHLIQVVSDLKAVAMKNKEQARQLLMASPSLSGAILQTLEILGQAPPANINSVSMPVKAELPPDVEAGLLQQVLRLNPDQLKSLPLYQQQQIIQLQQMHRQTS